MNELSFNDTATLQCTACDKVSVAIIFGSSLSVLGEIFIIATFFLYLNREQKANYWLLFWLSLSDFLTTLSWFVAIGFSKSGLLVDGSWECTFQGAFTQVTNVAAFWWTFCITLKIILEFHGIDKPKLEWTCFHSLSWGFPILSVIYLIVHPSGSQFGDAGTGWCWIKGARNPSRIFFFYGPLGFITLFALVSLISVGIRLRLAKVAADNKTNRFILNLAMYPCVLVVCWTGAFANRIQNALHPNSPIVGLEIWEYLLNTMQGFFNALVFGFAVRTGIKKGEVLFDSTADYQRLVNLTD